MAEVNAADLPAGSIVTDDFNAYIKDPMSVDPWVKTGETRGHPDSHVDELLADGAVVLRHGYGEGQ